MRPAIKCGLITGAGVCLWILGEYALGFHTTRLAIGAYSGCFSGLIPLTTLFLLLRRQRDASASGQLGLGAGLKSGLQAAFVSGVILYGFMFVYDHFINPGWLDNALDWRVAQLRAHGVTEIAIRDEITFYRRMNTPAGCLVSLVGGTTLLGGVLSAGLTLLLRWWPPRAPAGPGA